MPAILQSAGRRATHDAAAQDRSGSIATSVGTATAATLRKRQASFNNALPQICAVEIRLYGPRVPMQHSTYSTRSALHHGANGFIIVSPR